VTFLFLAGALVEAVGSLRLCLGVWREGEGRALVVGNKEGNEETFPIFLKECFFRE